MGITRREQQILALYDSGLRPKQIAASLGVAHGYVVKRITDLNGGGDHRRHAEAMRIGSLRLEAAIRAARGIA